MSKSLALALAVVGGLGLVTCGDDRDAVEPPPSHAVVTVDTVGLTLEGLAVETEPPPVASVDPTVAAVRIDPPTTVATTTTLPLAPLEGPEGSALPDRCTQWEFLLVEYAPPSGWDVQRMSRYMRRESGCWSWVHSRTSDDGLLQVNQINHAYLREALGEWVDRWTLLDPAQNVRAAAALCTFWVKAGSSCYQPWM